MLARHQITDINLNISSPFTRIENLYQLGQMLRDVRVSYKIEIEKVADDLCLKASFIKALEGGDWQSLPGDAYGRGYIKQYAEYLNLSGNEAIECCQRIQGKVETKLQYMDIVTTQENPSKSTLWFSAMALIAILIIWSTYQKQSVPQDIEDPLSLSAIPDSSTETIKAAKVTKNVEASCINIPHNRILPCYNTSNSSTPSIILKSVENYPIWQ